MNIRNVLRLLLLISLISLIFIATFHGQEKANLIRINFLLIPIILFLIWIYDTSKQNKYQKELKKKDKKELLKILENQLKDISKEKLIRLMVSITKTNSI